VKKLSPYHIKRKAKQRRAILKARSIIAAIDELTARSRELSDEQRLKLATAIDRLSAMLAKSAETDSARRDRLKLVR